MTKQVNVIFIGISEIFVFSKYLLLMKVYKYPTLKNLFILFIERIG